MKQHHWTNTFVSLFHLLSHHSGLFLSGEWLFTSFLCHKVCLILCHLGQDTEKTRLSWLNEVYINKWNILKKGKSEEPTTLKTRFINSYFIQTFEPCGSDSENEFNRVKIWNRFIFCCGTNVIFPKDERTCVFCLFLRLWLFVILPMTMSPGVGVLQIEPCDTAASLQPDTPENLDWGITSRRCPLCPPHDGKST